MKTHNVLIIGAGLTGLLTAVLLKEKGINSVILEGRDRIGGRILTKETSEIPPLEMGATWLGKQHTALNELLRELGIGIFEQELSNRAIYEPMSINPPQLVALPPNTDPSYRIEGGTSTLIKALADKLDEGQIQLSARVRSIEKVGNELIVKTDNQSFTSQIVIATLPPFLLTSMVKFIPELPESFTNIATQTHTWMGESIKISLAFAEPFWRESNLSGTVFSNVGPVSELYDHSNFEDTKFALKGFLNGSYYAISKAERQEIVLTQLEKYYGSKIRNFVTYEEAVWRKEPFTFAPYPTDILPHQNDGHAVFRESYMKNSLIIAGAETAGTYSGYMEGAVRSAKIVTEKVLRAVALLTH